ncbi:3-hydroxyacyl-CoA dehydrogenase family protein, partial [Candidatus Sumerlaeota bacterium]|nr:3-hydroxyacyl-CoA dehydrogenase family protein [Candidatus Sumerlaeota bacterium]
MPVLEASPIVKSDRKPKVDEILASRTINHVVVLGANGNMGYGSGALFTTAVPRVTFLARNMDKAEQGLGKAIRSVRSGTVGHRVTVGSYDADMKSALADADLIFEAVAEDFAVKDEIYAKVDAMRRPDSIVASVTSGLSITALAAKRSESFQRHFLGLHFFNPPNVIVGTEVIAGKKTDPAIVEFIDRFATKKLGRVIIRTSDTPGFAGNRVGFKVLNEVAQLAQQHGPVLMDKLVGPYTGRAMSPLATIDLVGWDVHHAIVDNVYNNAPDEARETNKMPEYMMKLMHRGYMGNKSGMGFFKKDEQLMALDVDTGDYIPAKQAKLPPIKFIGEIAACHRVGEYKKGMEICAKAHGDEAALAR